MKLKWIAAGLVAAVVGRAIAQDAAVKPSPPASPATGELTSIPVVLGLKRPSDMDILMLRNGDKLTGTVLNEGFSIRTSYAAIKLTSGMIAGIDLEGGPDGIEAIVSVNNNRFSGFIDEAAFDFRLRGGKKIIVRREKVLKVIFRMRNEERKGIPQRQFLVLKNGDFFSGKVTNATFSVATTYAKIPVELSNVDTIAFIGGKNVLTKITLLNEDKVQGILETEDIEVSLDVGGHVKVYQDRIETLYCREGFVPAAFLASGGLGPAGMLRGRLLTLDLGADVKMKLTLIPAGELTMGSPSSESDRNSDEGPLHAVTITKPFHMGITEVTQEQYRAVTGNGPSKFTGARNPVERVSWEDATAFCSKLSQKTGLGVLLPTEAQWEYACRAGSKTRFNFGDSDTLLGDYGWYGSNSGKQTHPVGEKKPNAFGLFDMHGNVWEWCSDSYGDSYANANARDPKGPATGKLRVLRGGSWDVIPRYCRAANRDKLPPGSRYNYTGFRVVVSGGG